MHVELMEVLRTLLSYGPKIPEVVVSLQKIVDVVSVEGANIARLLGISEFAAASPELAASEEQILGELAAAAVGGGHAGPIMDQLRALAAFLKQHPEYVTLILSLIKR